MSPETAPPATRPPTKHVYYSMTKSLCGTCKGAVDAKIVIRDDAVWFDKFCPSHGHQEVLVSNSAEWYLDCLRFIAPHTPPTRIMKEVKQGCPFDCGACAQHQQKVYLPVVPITSGCNLDCPICYTINKNEHAYHMSKEEMEKILQHLVEDHDEIDIINFTGGEPTLHPQLPEFLQMCRDAGIRRLTISTNGLKLLDEAYLRKLAALDARIILSLDTFDPAVDKTMLGANTIPAKLKVLELCEKYDVTVTILPAVAMGLNDKDVPKLLELVLSRPNILSLELHTLTFTGQGGRGFQRSARITIPDLHTCLEQATGGKLTWLDFVPSPLAHPHCYSISYLLMLDPPSPSEGPQGDPEGLRRAGPPSPSEGPPDDPERLRRASGVDWIPFTRLMPRQKLYELLGDSLYIQPREKLEEVFREMIDSIWAEPDRFPEGERVLATLRRLIDQLFPSGRAPLPLLERQKIAERSAKAIYIHSHMDEENFDVSRIMKCCVGVPAPDGSNIPTCSYNVLYREKDPRFADAKMLARMKLGGGNDAAPGH